jgi:hypothetical protein
MQVVVQANHVIFDDDGKAMSPYQQYKVNKGPKIDSYISNGLLTVITPKVKTPEPAPIVEPVEEEAPKAEPTKKANSNKITRAQETDSENTQEN